MSIRFLSIFAVAGLCTACASSRAVVPAPTPERTSAAASLPSPVGPTPKPVHPKIPAPKASGEDFSASQRALLRDLVEKQVLPALQKLPVGPEAAIVVRPFVSDKNAYLRGELKNAVTKSGRVCVEASDDMWETIVAELGWNEAFGDMLDAKTMTRIGQLLPTRTLLYGTLRLENGKGREPGSAELSLHVCDLMTRVHVWGQTFVEKPKPTPPPDHDDPSPVVIDDDASSADVRYTDEKFERSPLSVFVEVGISDDSSAASAEFGAGVASDLRAAFSDKFYKVVDAADAADVCVSVIASATAFDRELDYVRFDGVAKFVATLRGCDRILAETEVRRRGERAMGDSPAVARLREAFDPVVREFTGKALAPERIGLRAETLSAVVRGKDDVEISQRIKALHDAILDLKGVRAATVARERVDGGERVTVRVVCETGRLSEGLRTALVAAHPELFRKSSGKSAPQRK